MPIDSQLNRMQDEIREVLRQLDELAELWGDEGKFRRCRDRLRNLLYNRFDNGK